MSKRFLLSLAAVIAILTAGAAAAGTVYLPLATNQTVEGKQYRTIIWATNTSGQSVQVQVRFIPSGTDGTVGFDGPADETFFVGPRQSMPVAAGLGQIGMLEVRSDANLSYIGELHSFSPGGQRMSSTAVPLVDAARVLSAGDTAQLLAMERQPAGSESNLGILNLGGDEAACTIRAFRPDGSQILGSATVAVPPLGHREFPDALGILGEPSIDGARFEVSCDQSFYAYGVLLSRVPDSTQFVEPAAGGENALIDPAKSGQLLTMGGNFFTSTIAKGDLNIPVNVDAGALYESMTFEWDMWVPRLPTPLFTATMQLRRNSKGGLFWAHTIRGGGRNKSILDMGVGDGLVHQGESGVWIENANHHVRVHYDTNAGIIEFEVSRNGRVIERLRGGIGRFDLGHSGEGMVLILGLPKAYDNAFFPPYNFRFSNLRVSGVARAN
jgi:hypothetical protein